MKVKRIISYFMIVIAVILLSVVIVNKLSNKNEVVSVGTKVTKNNSVTKKIPFTVHWDDKGYEETRPDSISYNLYKAEDPNTVIDTITLNKSDYDENAESWQGVFDSVTLEKDNAFIIKEDDVDNYLRKYIRDQNTIAISVEEVKGNAELFYQDFLGEIKYKKLNSNDTFIIPNYSGKIFLKVDGTTQLADERIRFNSISSFEYDGEDYAVAENYDEMPTLEELTTNSQEAAKDALVFYNYNYSSVPDPKLYSISLDKYVEKNETAKGCNQILNRTNLVKYPIKKIWDDEGHEDERPDSVSVKVYKYIDQTNPVDNVVMTSSDAIDDYTWKKETNYLTKYDNNENEIEYIVKEDEIDNYISRFDPTAFGNDEMDMSSGIRIKFNPQTNLGYGEGEVRLIGYNTKTQEYFKAEDYYFKRNDMQNPNFVYNMTFDNSTLQKVSSQPWAMGLYVDATGGIHDIIGDVYPETRHPIPVADNYIWKYRFSEDSDIEWYFCLNMASWGCTYGLKIDYIEPIGKNMTIVNKYNKQNIDFTKVWDDEEFENLRTNKTINLYADNVLVATKTLRVEDYQNQNEWQSSFENMPIYGDDYHKIEYRIEEVNTDDNYTTTYEDDYYNGLEVKFSPECKTGLILQIYAKMEDGSYKEVRHNSGWAHGESPSGGGDDVYTLPNATVYIPSKEFYMYIEGTRSRIKIDSVKPAHVTSYANVNSVGKPSYFVNKVPIEITGTSNIDYDSVGESWILHYKYSETDSFGTNKIINKINTFDVTKKWKDEGYESLRPDSVSFNIKNVKDLNTVIKTVTLTENDEIDSYTWRKQLVDLPKYNSDNSIAKYVVEETPDIGYITNYELPKKVKAYRVTLSNYGDMDTFFSKVNIYLRKADNVYYYTDKIYVWDKYTNSIVIPNCSSNDYGDITMYVPKNYGFTIKSIEPVYDYEYYPNNSNTTTINSGNFEEIDGNFPYNVSLDSENWRYVHYKLDTTQPYAGAQTVSNAKEIRTVTVLKDWEDDGNRDGKRPESITVNLLADGVQIDSATLNANTNWTYTFENLNRYKVNGDEIKYTISEDAVEDYTTQINGLTITNSYNYETININGTKTWDDGDNQDGIRPDEITVDLVDDGTVVATTTASAQTNWKYSFENVPKYKNGGTEIDYVVSEHQITGYNTTYSGHDITNTYTPEKVQIQGIKAWDDDDDRDGKRPNNVTVNLLADGTKIDSKEVSSNTEWRYNFENLPKFKDGGVEIVYTLTEDEVAEYETIIDNYNITNKYVPEVIEVSGNKVWDDDNNRDGRRPDKATIHLYSDDDMIQTIELTEESDWSYSVGNLPKYRNHGIEINYSIIEDEIDGYTTIIDDYNITNSYIPKTTSIDVEKKWDDDNNRDGKRPEIIKVNLLADGEYLESAEFGDSTDWKYTFIKLPKYKDGGKEIVYTLTEDAVSDYSSKVDGYIITNTHEIEKTRVSGKITWDDENNTSQSRPDNVTIDLYAFDMLIKSVTITSDDDWEYLFDDLPKYQNGKEIIYTVRGANADKYKTTNEGFDFVEEYRESGGEIKQVKAGDKTIVFIVIALISGVIIYIIKNKEYISILFLK